MSRSVQPGAAWWRSIVAAVAVALSMAACSADEGIGRQRSRSTATGVGGADGTDQPPLSDVDASGNRGGANVGSGGAGRGSGSSAGSGGNDGPSGAGGTAGSAAGSGGSSGHSGAGQGGEAGTSTTGGVGGVGGQSGSAGRAPDASFDARAGAGGGSDASGGAEPRPDASSDDAPTRVDAVVPPGISTDPNLKVAFLGDTDTSANYKSVLNLVKSEGAAALVVEGDMSYSADPASWWTATESVLGTTFPVFISRGNHDDSSWSGYLPKAAEHLDGATRIAGAHDANYKTIWRGLVIATIRRGDTGAQITPFLQNEPRIWKICQWHQNQAAMQVGGKTDEMGWDVYETCRKAGALIQTGHEHSYSRTKTLVDITKQTVDAACDSATDLCVGQGRTFVNVVGLGGQSVRAQLRCLPAMAPYGCSGEWAFIYTSNQGAALGAQFITFHTGDPRKATGYFKNVNGQTVDTFTITADP